MEKQKQPYKSDICINPAYPEIVFLKEFANKPLLDGKNIKQLLTYEQTSLWWFAERWMADAYMHQYPSLKGIFKNEPLPQKTLFSPVATFLLNHLEQARFIARKYLIPQHKLDLSNKEDTIVITTHPSYCLGTNNIRIGPLIEKIREKHKELLVFYYDDLASWGGKTKLQTKTYEDTNPIEQFYSPDIIRKVSEQKKNFVALGKKILESTQFKEALQTTYQGKKLNLYPLLYQKFELMFSKILPEAITYILLSKEMLTAIQPCAVVTMSGNTTPGKSVIVAAHALGVPVLEIQEGLIGYDLDYVHTQQDIIDHYPLPDKIAVYGQHTKEFLREEGHFPEDKITIVGQLASDTLFKIKKGFQQNTQKQGHFRETFKIKEHEKVLVYTTNIDKEVWKIKEMVTVLFKSIYTLSDQFKFIVKLHPRDPYEKVYRELARQENVDNVIFVKDVNLYELFSVTHVLIAESSTVVLEALLFELPIVLLCFSSNIVDQSYVQSKAIFVVDDKKDLLSALQQTIFNKDVRDTLKENISRFVAQQAYKVDGNVAQRIVTCIEHLTKNKT